MNTSKKTTPSRTQVVEVCEASSRYNGRFGSVTAVSRTTSNRPYSVRFNDGKTRKFRTCDIVLAQ